MKEIIIAYDENTEASPVMGDWIGELVRCKDCVHRGNPRMCIVAKYAEQTGTPYFVVDNRGEWFCADGKCADT